MRGECLAVFRYVWLICACAAGMARGAPPGGGDIGSPVDLAEVGSLLRAKTFVGIEWENLREVHEVQVLVPDGEGAAVGSTLQLEWWGGIWPEAAFNELGCVLRQDDHWNGRWVRVATGAKEGPAPGIWRFTFPPLMRKEWEKALRPADYPDGKNPTYRGTLKVRIVSEEGALPEATRLKVFGASRWAAASFDITARLNGQSRVAGRVEVINGRLMEMASLPAPRATVVQGADWSAEGIADGQAGVRIRVRYAENKNPRSNDLTRVVVRVGKAEDATGFSFVPQRVMNEGLIRVRGLGVTVAESGTEADRASPTAGGRKDWDRCVRLRLRDQPEVTYASAMAGLPRLAPAMWIPIGVPSARQEVFIGPNGDWGMWWPSLNTEGRESLRCPFRQPYEVKRGRNQPGLYATLDTRADPAFDGKDREGVTRRLEDDRWPVLHAEWRTGAIHHHQVMAATILLGDIADDQRRLGDETVVLLSKLEITNRSDDSETSTVHVRYSHDAGLSLEEDGIVAIEPLKGTEIPEGLTALRGQLSVDRSAGGGIAGWEVLPASEEGKPPLLRWQAELEPGQTRTLYLKQPFVDLLDGVELQRLREISYEEEVPKILAYWRHRLAREMQIDVPDRAINHFYAANLWHNLITTDRDPVTKLYNQFVGTWGYTVFANETVMIARSMDMRGEHLEAERFLAPMLHFQGHQALPGPFPNREGVFHSAGEYTAKCQYTMNHGFVMWGVADHYLFTRDRAYLERVAPRLIKGCDFLIRERRRTMSKRDEPGSRVQGLAPACPLEDISEFKYWFATNGYFYLGMKRVGQALADIEHPQAKRIAEEAELYRGDIERALREATTRAELVRLRDGEFIPFVPTHAFEWRHLSGGWVRDALYCSLHAAMTEVVSPTDPIITWMLDELEDNVFFSRQSGYGLRDVDRHWLERGGVTKQPCLLDTPIVYMARDEIEAALRSFWNTYALLVYPDVQCLAEWATQYGKPGGPFYKTSDESRFIMWLRQLLVWENGDQLWLGRAAPRAWLEDGKVIRVERAPTFFGTAGLVIRSEAARGRIHAEVIVPSRNPPREVWLRLRHPSGKSPARVVVDGRVAGPDRIVGEDIRIIPGEHDAKQPVEITAEYER